MIRAELSSSYDAKRKRISRIPTIARKSARASTKRDAYGIVETFRRGIIRNSLRLASLKESTVRQKVRRGYPKPRTPLYGLGEASGRSYLNMLRVSRERNGWRIRPGSGRHHSGRVSLRTLFMVHEYGAVISQRNRTIRIPPRPAFRKAYERFLRRRKAEEPTEQVREAIRQHIRTGSMARTRQVQAEMRRQGRFDA